MIIPLKEMHERRAELQAKQADKGLYSEEAAELSNLHELIALRDKYLLRYINHFPFAVETVKAQAISAENKSITEVVHGWVATRAVACKSDGDDLITLLTAQLGA